MPRAVRHRVVAVAGASALLVSACAKSANSGAQSSMPEPELPAKMITVQVVASDPKTYTITAKGVGLPAPDADGTEVFKVAVGDAEVPYAGKKVRGELSQSEGAWRLDNLWPADATMAAATTEAVQLLKRDAVELGRKAFRSVGDLLPPFALYNQDGAIVRPETLRGRKLVIDFVFTRCGNANMCPANTLRMAKLQRMVKAAKLDNVTFVTISFDPDHDTPGVLRQYADSYGLDPENFQLLTGPAEEISPLLEQFGILTRQENGTIVHTMATLLVSPEGRIVHRMDGDMWQEDDFLERLQPVVNGTAKPPPGISNQP